MMSPSGIVAERCIHLKTVEERRRIRTLTSAAIIEVFGCGVHKACTLSVPVPGVVGCCSPIGGERCQHHQEDPYRWVAPLGTVDCRPKHEGRAQRKPWDYPVTVAIPHLDTPELLHSVVALHRLQSTRPYMVVVDTGSSEATCRRLEAMRAEDLEIHFVRSNGYRHSSAPVTTAMDVAFAVCHTNYLFCTHADVFPRRRDLLAWLIAQCGEETPAVGWEMSPRAGIDHWRGTLSHTATLLWMPTMWMIGASWSMDRWYASNPITPAVRNGWPDTETSLEACFRDWSVRKKIIGPETNFERQQTEWWDHARSITSLRVHAPGSAQTAAAEAYTSEALAEAQARVQRWEADGLLVT